MPTGYTEGVQSGRITEFKDFALLCARAMGACVMQRDEPLNAPIPELKPDTYHAKAAEKAQKELAAWRDMSGDDIEAAYKKDFDERLAYYESSKNKNTAQRQRYEDMLAKVRAWNPPTGEHFGLRKFMVEQLERSINFDCYAPSAPEKQDSTAWYADRLAKLVENVQYHEEHQQEENKRTDERNEWIRQLRESLAGD